jgi:hypothetical protein
VSSSDTLDEMVPSLRRLEHLIKCTDLTGKMSRSTAMNPYDGLIKVMNRNKTVQGEHAEVLYLIPSPFLSLLMYWRLKSLTGPFLSP